MSNTIFDKDSLSKIEQAVKVMREIQDEIGKVYWEKHKEIAAQSYASTNEQLDEMTKLGELAKSLQTLKRATGDMYCFTITKQ
jgi:outer membrane protein assembly factor BamD (BamD/ComL family)